MAKFFLDQLIVAAMFDILGSLLNNSFSSASSFVAPIKLVAFSDHNVLGFPRMLINRVNAAMNAAADKS